MKPSGRNAKNCSSSSGSTLKSGVTISAGQAGLPPDAVSFGGVPGVPPAPGVRGTFGEPAGLPGGAPVADWPGRDDGDTLGVARLSDGRATPVTAVARGITIGSRVEVAAADEGVAEIGAVATSAPRPAGVLTGPAHPTASNANAMTTHAAGEFTGLVIER
ncbi:MAG: hypothetical protein EPO26_09715 [Chloroflexota bacterium]|nr:MAG: hypothetical protein EPO26_09715 [Chloroflexota bacterium]